jgi:hypothetical protein
LHNKNNTNGAQEVPLKELSTKISEIINWQQNKGVSGPNLKNKRN